MIADSKRVSTAILAINLGASKVGISQVDFV
jgi:hypothetical protein